MKGKCVLDVLVTGGSGYIGSSLARFFSIRGLSVGTVDVTPQPDFLESLNIPHIICDLRNYDALARSLPEFRVAVHAAIIQIPLINKRRKLAYETNILATQNICKMVDKSRAKGLILTSSWHVFGESGLNGVVTEGFGYRPDRVEDRARLYALCKNGQEVIVRLFNEFSDKSFGIIRMGTVLGEGMPEKTAANIFINQALEGKDLTPFKHSMHRPMFFVSIMDVQRGFFRFTDKILRGECVKSSPSSLEYIVNLVYPEPTTILELAEITRDLTNKITEGKMSPKIRIIDQGIPSLFEKGDKNKVRFDITRVEEFLGMSRLMSPRQVIEEIIRKRVTS